MGVGEIIGWVFNKGVGFGVDIADGITLGNNDESNMSSSGGSFDGFNDGKHVGLLE